MFFRVFLIVLIPAITLVFSHSPNTQAEEPALAQYYGFKPVELFKLERRSRSLIAGDLNHDGRTDLILIDNSHSRLDLLLQQEGNAKPKNQPANEVNHIENSSLFNQVKISVPTEVISLALGDFNHDGRTDISYLGTPDKLVIHFQAEGQSWSQKKTIRIPDLEKIPWSLAAGDLNNDQLDDLVVLGKNATLLLYQKAETGLDSPIEIMNTSEKMGIAQIADLNGDGKNDLCYSASNDKTRFLAARLQNGSGKLGPELQFDLHRPRALTLANVDGKPGHEMIAVDSKSGRVKVLKLETNTTSQTTDEPQIANQLIQYGFGALSSGKDRELVTGDLDGDGLQDVMVNDSSAARIFVFRQNEDHQLEQATTFPSLMAINQLRMADLDQDGRDEVIVLSTKEKTLGISQFKAGRLTFPQALSLPVEEAPHAIEIININSDGRPSIVYSSGIKSPYELHTLDLKKTTAGFEFESSNLVQELNLKASPRKIQRCDANADGLSDLLIFRGRSKPPKLLLGQIPTPKKKRFAEIPEFPGIGLTAASPSELFIASPKGYPIYNAQSKFARSLTLNTNQRWQVVDQFNANESNARLIGVAAINLDQQTEPEVVLIDVGVDKLRLMRKTKGENYELWKEVELGGFPFVSSSVADLNGDSHPDLILLGKNSFAVLYANQKYPELKELTSFESELRNSYISDVIAGDLNNDNHVDIVALDTRSHRIEILDYNPPHGLRTTMNFNVFQEKGFQSKGETRGREPREGLITDVTGDGLPDMILLSHDRILVYPQDSN